MTAPFAQRLINVIITAGPVTDNTPAGYVPPTFGPNKSNTITLQGHQVSCTITQQGLYAFSTAAISLWGMKLDDMNQLASLANQFYFQNQNKVTVLAGDSVSGMSVAFEGDLSAAVPNFTDLPNVSFDMLATVELNAAMVRAKPNSYPGSADAAVMCHQIATALNLKFENNGVSVQLKDQYLPGTYFDQLQRIADAANIRFIIEHGILAIWPFKGYRTSQTNIQTVSPETGLIGYPSYTQFGVNFRTLYNPALLNGSNVNLQSSLKPASREWSMYSLTHTLESLIPGGAWFTDVQACLPGFMPPVTGG